MPSPHRHPSSSCWNGHRCNCPGFEKERHEGWEQCRDLYNKNQARYRLRKQRPTAKTGQKRGTQKRVLSDEEVESLRRQLGLKVMNGTVVAKDPQSGAK